MINYTKQITVLYVEDEEDIRAGYERAISRYCKTVFIAKNGAEGLELYKQVSPDIVVSDIKMPIKNGIEMVKDILNIDKNQAIIFTTAHTESDYTLAALNLQVDGYLLKPVDKNKLKDKLEQIAKNIILEKENIKNQKILQKILDIQTSITLLTDFEKIEFASKSFFNLFGVDHKNEFYSLYPKLLDIFVKHETYINADTKEEFIKKYKNAQEEFKIISIASVVGEVKVFHIEIDAFDNLFLVTLTDITKIQLERLNTGYKATHDSLTGSFNRAKFEEIFDEKYKRVKRYNRTLCIAILDIDFFKKVNDNYGHQIGDEVLKELAKLSINQVRSTDFFARWGGEEFILLMDETSLKNATKVCEKLRKSVENFKKQNLPQITISIGLSQIQQNDTKDSFFKRADEALYKAKKNGRNMVVSHG
ncbi:MAG: diguanylate cyclase [Sulfurospirillum sp.]|nr:diguanylate cyclase [Sulfurospirillum sp.]MBL0703564.1 diguanylate cyclase [Sulfurospirillum sp.]